MNVNVSDLTEFLTLEKIRQPLITQTRAGNGSSVIDDTLDEIEQREFQIANDAGVSCDKLAEFAQDVKKFNEWQREYSATLARINSGRSSRDDYQTLSGLEQKIDAMGKKYKVSGHAPELMAFFNGLPNVVIVDG